MAYAAQDFHHRAAIAATVRLEEAGEKPGDHMLGADTWAQVREHLDREADAETLSVDSLSEAPYRVYLSTGDIVADDLGWIYVQPEDSCDPMDPDHDDDSCVACAAYGGAA